MRLTNRFRDLLYMLVDIAKWELEKRMRRLGDKITEALDKTDSIRSHKNDAFMPPVPPPEPPMPEPNFGWAPPPRVVDRYPN